MKRLTKRLPNGVIHVDFAKQKESVMGLLAAIEDILGDEYDLDRLRELIQADRTIGREICFPNDNVRETVEGFQSWKDGGISFMLVDGRHRYSMSSDLVYKFLVVRCRECKKWDTDPDSYGKDDGPKGKCMKSFEETYDTDFCSYGQRKEADHD